MRLWHKNLIQVLPRQQLVAQWRELSSIVGAIQKNNTPNHILVNYVLDYDYDHFISYAYYVRQEMTARGYRTMDKVWDKIVSLKPNYKIIPFGDIYSEIHEEKYFNICYWNLYEKHIRGGIDDDEWDKINLKAFLY